MEQVAMDAILAAACASQPANQLAVQPAAGGHRRQREVEVEAGQPQQQQQAAPPPRTLEDVVLLLGRLAITHDRELQDVKDMVDFVVVIRAEEINHSTRAIRAHWQTQRPAEGPHPLGSQRSVVFASLCDAVRQAVSGEALTDQNIRTKIHEAVAELMQSTTQRVDACIQRMTCRFKEPAPGKPWIWTLRMSLHADEKFSVAVRTLADFSVSEAMRPKGISIQPSRNKDGPTVKALEAWVQQKTGRRGRPATQPKRQRQR